ncbi:MAG: hypothetical protein ACYTXA_19960 [Nostoc sp.]
MFAGSQFLTSRRRLGGAERNPTDYQDVGLRKASTQPTIFLQLCHPGLQTHKYDDLFGSNGEEVFEA